MIRRRILALVAVLSSCVLLFYPFYSHTAPRTKIRLDMQDEFPAIAAVRQISSDIGQEEEAFNARNGVVTMPSRTLRANAIQVAKEYIIGLWPHQAVVPGMVVDIEIRVPDDWDFVPLKSGCVGPPTDRGASVLNFKE